MSKITITTQIKRSIDLEVDIGDVIESINLEPMTTRFNFIAQLLNDIEINKETLTENQIQIIKNYLEKTIQLLNIKQ